MWALDLLSVMIVGTFLGIVFIPLFFVVVQRLFVRREPAAAGATPIVGIESHERAVARVHP